MEPARLETGPDRKRRRVVDEAVPAAVAADVVHVDPAPTPTPTPTPPDPDAASAAEPRCVQFNDSHSFEIENGTGRAPSQYYRVLQPPRTAWRGHIEVRGNEIK